MAPDLNEFLEPDIAVFCATEAERKAIGKLLKLHSAHGETWSEAGNFHAIVNVKGGTHHHLAVPERAYAQIDAARIGQSLIEEYRSIKKLIFVGVAGAVPPVRIGDLVVSDSVVNLELGTQASDGEMRPRYTFPKASGDLLKIVKELQDEKEDNPTDWRRTFEDMMKTLGETDHAVKEGAHWPPDLHIGLIASSNKRMNDRKLRDRYKKRFSTGFHYQLCAFEMEGSAVAAISRGDIPFLIIRSTSDMSDGDREHDDVLQPHAANVAAAFLITLIERCPGPAISQVEVSIGEHKMYDLGCRIAKSAKRRLLIVQRTPSLLLGSEPLGESEPYSWDKEFIKVCNKKIKEVEKNLELRFYYFYWKERTKDALDRIERDTRLNKSRKEKMVHGIRANMKFYKDAERRSGTTDPRFRFDSVSRISGPVAIGDDEAAFWLAEYGEGKEKVGLVIHIRMRELADRLFEEYARFVKHSPSRLQDLLIELGLADYADRIMKS
jgi:nucleoside phosphorylase